MNGEYKIAKRIGFMEGVSETYYKIDEVLERIPMTDGNFELRSAIRSALTEMLGKSVE